jgi:hypothetical protein
MEALSPFLDPMSGHRGWVVPENRLAPIVPLLEADALPTAKVDRRPDLHQTDTPADRPAKTQNT